MVKVYTGQWLGTRRHGEGMLLRPGSVERLSRFKPSQALFARPDGGRYEGQFVNDRACGMDLSMFG
jgi:hypothetical protein